MGRVAKALGAILAGLLLAAGGPAASQSPSDWQAQWARSQAAGRAEGKLVILMSGSIPRRDFILSRWQQSYPEIALSITLTRGTGFVQGIVTERQAGKYLWDIWHSGPNTGAAAIAAGLLDPLRPELLLPEVAAPEIWGGWQDAFYDRDRTTIIGLFNDIESPFYNADVVAPEKARALGLKLLLEPEAKGRIAWFDPRIEGPGLNYLALVQRVLGADAMRRILVDQEPLLLGSLNEVAGAVARGKAIIGFAGRPEQNFREYRAAGLKLDIRLLGNTPETAFRGTDGGALAVFNRRPHPNAARLFVNWLMSQEVAAELARVEGVDSRRRDVPPVDPSFAMIQGADYFDAQRPEADALRQAVLTEAKRLRPQ